jgi:hypothetical protein
MSYFNIAGRLFAVSPGTTWSKVEWNISFEVKENSSFPRNWYWNRIDLSLQKHLSEF